MNETVCDCGRPTRDNAYSCDECLGRLTRVLAEIPWLMHQLEISMTNQKGTDYRNRVTGTGGSKETPLPLNYGAFHAASQLRTVLLTWTRHCHDNHIEHQSPQAGLPILEPVHMSRWMMWRVDGLAFDADGHAAITDIQRAFDAGMRTIDRPADKWFAGPCNGLIGDEVECGRDMYVTPGKPQVKCGGCGAVHDVKARREWLLDAANNHLATASEIARAVTVLSEVAKSTTTLTRLISDWRNAGRLAERGHVKRRGQDRPLYRVGDVVDLVEVHMSREQARTFSA